MRKSIERILYFLAHANIIEAIGGASAVLFTFLVLSAKFQIEPIIIATAVTFFLYTLNRIGDIPEDKINYLERIFFIQKHSHKLLIVGIILFIISLTVTLLKSILSFIIILLPFIIVFCYSFLRLKKFLFIKNIVVALMWSIIPFFVATYISVYPIHILLAVSIIIFLIILINTIVFDIKDMLGDKFYGIKTLPNVYGIDVTKKICYFLDALLLMVFLIFFITNLLPSKIFLPVFITLYIAYYVKTINKQNAIFISEYIANLDMIVLVILSMASFIIW